jgi:hypothetical protein
MKIANYQGPGLALYAAANIHTLAQRAECAAQPRWRLQATCPQDRNPALYGPLTDSTDKTS